MTISISAALMIRNGGDACGGGGLAQRVALCCLRSPEWTLEEGLRKGSIPQPNRAPSGVSPRDIVGGRLRHPRVTNAFSKKRANMRAALALYFAWWNFCPTHRTIRWTLAVEAGITDHIWTVGELLA